MPPPGAREGLEERNWDEATEHILRTAESIENYAAKIDEARRVLDGGE